MATVAIVGAGLTGLTAGYRLKQQGIGVAIYEACDRIGGVIRSERRDGYLAELGPHSLSPPAPPVAALIDEIGLARRIVSAAPAARHRYILRRGRLVPLPLTPAE